VDYAALIDNFGLQVPFRSQLTLISERHVRATTDLWQVLTPRHEPADTLAGHLTFAIKREGVQLGVLAALFRTVGGQAIADLVSETPTGAFSRRIWFLYEWLTGHQLNLPPLGKVKAIPVIDPELQYGLTNGVSVSRQKIINNLPGTAASLSSRPANSGP
jgi:hypothetical protein